MAKRSDALGNLCRDMSARPVRAKALKVVGKIVGFCLFKATFNEQTKTPKATLRFAIGLSAVSLSG